MPATTFRHVAYSFMVLAVLAGCASPGGKPQAPPDGGALPSDPNALVLGAELALQRGQHLEASRAYLKAAQASQSEELAEQATRVAYEHGHWSIVLAAAERWLELNSTNEEGRRFAGLAALHMYQIDRAAAHLGTLLDTAYINPQAGFLALLPQLSDEAAPPAVAAVFQRLIVKYPDLTEAHYALGQAALQADNFALAYQHAQKARELGQYWAPAGLLLARVQIVRGETDAGLATARQIIEQNNQDSYRLEYALMLLQAGKEEEGRRELSALASSETAAPVVERTLADIDFQLGNREAAAQRFSNLVSSGRFVFESLFYLGAIAESRGALDDALQIYERVTGGDLAMAAQTRAARIKVERQGLPEGLKHLEDFAATRSQYKVDVISARARLLADNGDSAGALALLDGALKEYPDATELRFTRIFQLEEANKVDAAVADLRKLVVERPEDPAAANALGYTLVDRTRQHREGLKLIEKALEMTPDSGAILDSMGWALHRLGRDAEALPYLEHARRRINDPEIELHMGEVLAALGRRDEARELLQKANERYPNNADLQQQLKKLAK
jgi:tetratricopeptide (TPR) repeat protein